MENREARNKEAMNLPVPLYGRLFFDHLYAEYVILKPVISDQDTAKLLNEIHEKREQRTLSWSDIYTFDLSLVDVRPAESLVRKAFDSRARYRAVAGQKEYDEYIASKPLDLGAIHFDPDAQPPKPSDVIERELRADIRFLLSKFYLYYALLPMREGLRDRLTKKAVIVTSCVVVLIAFAIALNVGGSLWIPGLAQYLPVVVTVLTVTLAGIIGGCVSMLQRIQSAPTEGDALFNLAALTNGWRAILLAPLYGGIFACLLFVMFAGGVLNGAVFPTIVTPSRSAAAVAASPTPASPPSVGKAASPSPSATPPLTTSDAGKTASPTSPSQAATATPRTEIQKTETPSPTPSGAAARPSPAVLQIKDFLRETGPSSGVAYALLIIWSFLAGFAERLVPDTLNRLVQKNSDIEGGR